MEALKKTPGHTRLYRRGATYYHRAAVPQDSRQPSPHRAAPSRLPDTGRREAEAPEVRTARPTVPRRRATPRPRPVPDS
ncbi:hypothetical protein DLJ49_01300 [Rhodovulum sp. 12E13]|nr:hypothetical protein DLJ49_01300 [Rhodovulum sp. 12E13]